MGDWQEKQPNNTGAETKPGIEAEAQAIIAALRHRQGTTAKLAELEAGIRAQLRFEERKKLAILREPLLEERRRLEQERQERRRRLERQKGLEWSVHLEERRRLDERQQAEVAERRRLLQRLLAERRPDFADEDLSGPAATAVLAELHDRLPEGGIAELALKEAGDKPDKNQELAKAAAALQEIVATAALRYKSAGAPDYTSDNNSDNNSEDIYNIEETGKQADNSNDNSGADLAENMADEPPAYDSQLAQNIAAALGIEIVEDEPEDLPGPAAMVDTAGPEENSTENNDENNSENENVNGNIEVTDDTAEKADSDNEAVYAFQGEFGIYQEEEEPPAEVKENVSENITEELTEELTEEMTEEELNIGEALELDAAGRLTSDAIEAELQGADGAAGLRARIFGQSEEAEDGRKLSLPPNALLPLLFLAVIFVVGFCTYGLHFKIFAREVAQVNWGEQPLWAGAEELIDRWEAKGAENLAWQEQLVALDGLAARVFDKRFVRDTDYSYSIIRDNHGWLQFITFDAKPREIVRSIGDYLELEVPILYVQPPTKFIEGYTEFPPTLHDKTAANVAQNLALLAEAGVPWLDLRAAAAADGLDREHMFYRTDHHWRVETAFWAVGRTVAETERLWGWQLDSEGYYTDLANWRQTEYRQNFLGSQGRRVGRFYGGLDDFTLLVPDFDTRFRLEKKLHTGQLEVSQGNFEEVILDKSLLEAESVYTNRYGAYWGADYPTVLADNLLIGEEGLSVMIIKDSYSLPYGAFLATMVDKLYMVDLRYFAIDGLAQYIREVQPDLILIMYS